MMLALLIHAAATLMMTGVIWLVQLCQYPLFARVGAGSFADYHQGHSARISLVVVPLMLVEFGSAAWLAWRLPANLPPTLLYLGLGMAIAVWLATFGLSVPQHSVLSRGFDVRAHQRLITTNWVRTALWSARAVLVLTLISLALP